MSLLRWRIGRLVAVILGVGIAFGAGRLAARGEAASGTGGVGSSRLVGVGLLAGGLLVALAAVAPGRGRPRAGRPPAGWPTDLADALPQIFWTAGPEGRVDHYSRGWFEFTGLSEERAYAPDGREAAVHPDDLATCRRDWSDAIRSGEPYSFELRLRDGRDGSFRWHLGHARPLRDAEGHVARWIGTLIDIDDRRRSEAALEAEHHRTQEILEGITDSHFAFDHDWRFVAVNQRAAEKFGRPREQLLGQVLWEVFPEATRSEFFRQYRRAVREQVPVHFEALSWIVGRWYEVHAYPSPEGLSVFTRDINERAQAETALRRARDELERRIAYRTADLAEANRALQAEVAERRQAERALLEREAILRSFYEGAPMAMGVVEVLDGDTRFISANPPSEQFLGVAEGGLEGRLTSEIGYPPDGIALWLEKYAESQRTGRPVRFEYVSPLRTNRRWVSATVSPLGPGPDGRPRFSFVAEDVGERKQAEEALRRRNRELEALNAAASGINRSLRRGRVLAELRAALARHLGLSGCLILRGDHLGRAGSACGRALDADMLAEVVARLPARARGVGVSARPAPGGPLPGLVLDGADPAWRHGLCIPLPPDGGPARVLCLFGPSPLPLDDGQAAFFEVLGQQVGAASRNARLFAQARAGRCRLRALSLRLVRVQEAERRRLARELHDEVGGELTGLRLALDVAARRGDGVRLDEARGLVDRLMGQVRRLSLDLRPAMLDDLGLRPALLGLIEHYEAQTEIRVAFEHDGLDDRFGPEVETAAYRIIQESLTNVARHAGAAEAVVRVWAEPGALNLQVQDEGSGFDPRSAAPPGRSSGLAGMRERVLLLGGQFDVESAPGRGTRLIARLPRARAGRPRARRAGPRP